MHLIINIHSGHSLEGLGPDVLVQVGDHAGIPSRAAGKELFSLYHVFMMWYMSIYVKTKRLVSFYFIII